MSMSTKDKQLLVVIALILLFGITLANFRKCADNIAIKQRSLKTAEENISMQKELIAAKDVWAKRYEDKKPLMPVFNVGDQVDTYWLNIMDLAAERHGVKIRNRHSGTETKVSDVYEFPIEVKDWESELEPFVNFMYALQAEGAMLDIRTLTITPIANKPGLLKGSFVLYCAYMRSNTAE